MAFKNPFKDISIGGIILFMIGMVLVTQIFSLLISLIFKNVPILKTGGILIIISGSLAFFFLAKIVLIKKETGFEKMDLFGFILLLMLTIGLYMFGNQFAPQIFSIFDDSALTSAQGLMSFIGLP